jgi:predicted GTPase
MITKTSLEESIQEVELLIKKGSAKIGEEKVEQAVIVVGQTGHGKSSLVNYLAGAKLTAKHQGYPPELYIDAQQPVGEINIVHGTISGTSIPNKFFDAKTGITYFDCPGFDDTRGPEQDIANAFYIKRVFDVAEQVKVVVVINEQTILDRNAFKSLTEKLTELFVDNDQLKKGISLVISKSHHDSTINAFKQTFEQELLKQEPY